MRAVLLASLVLAVSASAAHADTAKCTKGTEWISVKRELSNGSSDKSGHNDGGHAALYSFRLWEGGAWEWISYSADKPKDKPVTTTGCLKAADTQALTDAFATKPAWEYRFTPAGSCENRGAWTHEVYSVKSQVVYTREMCGGDSVDDKSLKVIAAIDRAMGAAR